MAPERVRQTQIKIENHLIWIVRPEKLPAEAMLTAELKAMNNATLSSLRLAAS
jgi:hypothetical protein